MPVLALRALASATVSAALLAVGPALAADGQGSGGMPQFDPGSFPSQIFWLVVSFAILYFLMATMVLPRIGGIVENRERKIQADLSAAQQANDAARAAGAEQDKALATARTEASHVIRQASDAAAAQTTARMHEIGEKLAAEIGEAERRIAEQRAQALSGLTGMSNEIASAVLTRLVGSADAGQVSRAVEAAAKAGNR